MTSEEIVLDARAIAEKTGEHFDATGRKDEFQWASDLLNSYDLEGVFDE